MDWVGALEKDSEEQFLEQEEEIRMSAFLKRKTVTENIGALGPALAILLATLILSTLVAEFPFNFGAKALWKTLFRFLCLSFLLTLPIFLLPGICSVVEVAFNQGKRYLIQLQKEHDIDFHPLKNWVVRPFQGIGLSMLLATKLLAFLEIYTGSRITLDTILPQGKFDLGRFVGSISIGIGVSLLLSCLWTLDDLGVRLCNKKTREVRMIGRYVGLLLPIPFGLYGMTNLFEEHSRLLAVQYIFHMIIVSYPPFVVFNVLHARYLAKHEVILLRRLKMNAGVKIKDAEKVETSGI